MSKVYNITPRAVNQAWDVVPNGEITRCKKCNVKMWTKWFDSFESYEPMDICAPCKFENERN